MVLCVLIPRCNFVDIGGFYVAGDDFVAVCVVIVFIACYTTPEVQDWVKVDDFGWDHRIGTLRCTVGTVSIESVCYDGTINDKLVGVYLVVDFFLDVIFI